MHGRRPVRFGFLCQQRLLRQRLWQLRLLRWHRDVQQQPGRKQRGVRSVCLFRGKPCLPYLLHRGHELHQW